MKTNDETAITEISILPDGRVCVFGASREVVEVLADLEARDDAMRQRSEHVAALMASEAQNKRVP